MNLPPEAGHRPSLRGVHARGRIDGLMLDMALEQTFANAGTEPLEVIYTFPVPLAATLLGLDVDIGGRKLAAQVLSRRRAEGVYEGAVASGDSAVMVESAGDGRYTLNLGNLLPGDTFRVTVRYGQLLRFEQGIIRVTLPTTLGTWYGDPIRDGGLAPHQVPLTGGLDDYPFSIELAVSGPLAAAQAECTTHTLSIERGEARLQASLRARAWLDRDFVFTLSGLPDGSSAVRVPDYATAEGEAAAEVVIASLCPRFGDARPAAVNLKLLADCSGSMAGASIESSRAALAAILSELEPADRFSLSCFGTHTLHLFDALQPAFGASLTRARDHVRALLADMGGTEMEQALQQTLTLPGAEGGACLLLITDGQVWAVDAVVETAVRSGQRIFVIGVGYSPSEAPLRRLADETGGACDIVPPGEDLHEAILRMFQRIRHQTHARLSVEWGAEPLWQVPLPPAIYPGDTVHLMAAFPRGCPVRPVLQLQAGDLAISCAAPPVQSLDNSGLSRLAAARRLATLPEHARSDWAVRYQLVSADSSLVLTAEREVKSIAMPTLERIRHTQAAMHAADLASLACASFDQKMPSEGRAGAVWADRIGRFQGDAKRKCEAGLRSAAPERFYLATANRLRQLNDQEIAMVRVLLNQHIVEASDLDRLPLLFFRSHEHEALRNLARIHRFDPAFWQIVLLILRALCGDKTLTRHVRRVLDQLDKGLNGMHRSDLRQWLDYCRPAESSAP